MSCLNGCKLLFLCNGCFDVINLVDLWHMSSVKKDTAIAIVMMTYWMLWKVINKTFNNIQNRRLIFDSIIDYLCLRFTNRNRKITSFGFLGFKIHQILCNFASFGFIILIIQLLKNMDGCRESLYNVGFSLIFDDDTRAIYES